MYFFAAAIVSSWSRPSITFDPFCFIKAIKCNDSLATFAVHRPVIGGSCHDMMKPLYFSSLSVTPGIVMFVIMAFLATDLRGSTCAVLHRCGGKMKAVGNVAAAYAYQRCAAFGGLLGSASAGSAGCRYSRAGHNEPRKEIAETLGRNA
jgi:hypothetical protein